MDCVTMSISDEAVCCTGQIEMLNGLLKSNRCRAQEPASISAIINSSTATLSVGPLIVRQAENFKQMSCSLRSSEHIRYMCMYSNVYSRGTEHTQHTPALRDKTYKAVSDTEESLKE